MEADKIYAALAAAQALASSVEKDARNTFHKYAYASAEAMISEAKVALAQHGIAVVPLRQALVFDFMMRWKTKITKQFEKF